MKIPLDIVQIDSGYFIHSFNWINNIFEIDQMRKRQSSITTPPSFKKSPSISSNHLDRQRQLEEDVLILGQISDLAKSITTPHQVIQLLLSIKTLFIDEIAIG